MTLEQAPAQAARGERVALVRYFPTADGWGHELIEGRYDGRDSSSWRLVVDGTVVAFDRSRWELCRP